MLGEGELETTPTGPPDLEGSQCRATSPVLVQNLGLILPQEEETKAAWPCLTAAPGEQKQRPLRLSLRGGSVLLQPPTQAPVPPQG